MVRTARIALVAALAVVWTATAGAQTDAGRPIKIIVPFAEGSPADVYARVVAQNLSEALKTQVTVDVRPGDGVIAGTAAAAKSPPDGSTLVVVSSAHSASESLVTGKPYRLMSDLVPVAPLNYSDMAMVVSPAFAAADMQDFLELAKSKPGELRYASSGPAEPDRLAAELFKSITGLKIAQAPYTNSAAALASVVDGTVTTTFAATILVAPLVQAGKLRVLGTTGQALSSLLADTPTLEDAGVSGYDATVWLGLMAPAGTPKPVIERLNVAINDMISRNEVQENWMTQGVVPLQMDPDEFAQFLRNDIAKWAKVVKAMGGK